MSWNAASSSPAALSPRRTGNQDRRGEAAREGWHTHLPMNSSAPCVFKSQLLQAGQTVNCPLDVVNKKIPKTHVGIRVVELHQHVGGRGHGYLRVTKDFHLVENKRLVPGGVESVAHRHSFLGLVEERHDGVGVWTQRDGEAFSVSKTVAGLSTVWLRKVLSQRHMY